jgi:excisionase family DNA binding protein
LHLSTTASDLGISREYVKKLILTGQLKGAKYGPKLYRVPAAEIERYRQRRMRMTVLVAGE